MFTVAFWKAAAERALKTVAQALIAVLAVGQTTILTVDWQQALAVAGTAGLLSILSSVASGSLGNYGPSLANETVAPPVAHAHDDIEDEGQGY